MLLTHNQIHGNNAKAREMPIERHYYNVAGIFCEKGRISSRIFDAKGNPNGHNVKPKNIHIYTVLCKNFRPMSVVLLLV